MGARPDLGSADVIGASGQSTTNAGVQDADAAAFRLEVKPSCDGRKFERRGRALSRIQFTAAAFASRHAAARRRALH
jgi:hypothetical protein